MFQFIKAVYRLVIGTVKYVTKYQSRKVWPSTSPRPTVQVKQGLVCGTSGILPNGAPYHCFKGIPYAKPPVGDLRFKPPVPLEKFDTPVIDCALERSEFIQFNMFLTSIVTGSEKALYLNLYTPKLPAEQNNNSHLPVMIYIHGGGYVSGSASSFLYDPVHLLQEGVIVVIMNYRLGPLGFLCMPSMGIAGNAGLKDQMMAFKWVNENIRHFGGDHKNVTIFGESAGSWSTYLHYLSANSRRYFNRAICQSGVVCTQSFFQVDPADKARKLAKALGYRGISDLGVYETLMKAPAHLIVKHQHDVASAVEKKLAMNYLFRPVIEQTETEDSIITKSPEAILKDYGTIQTPLITGCTSSEGILALYIMNLKGQMAAFDKEPERLVPCVLKENSMLDCNEVGRQIKKFYFGEKKFNSRTKRQICDLMSDSTFITTTMLSSEWLAKYQPNVQHYHYRFSYHGRFSLYKGFFKQGDVDGASHCDDTFYIFDSSMLPLLPCDSVECKVRKHLVQMWTNFAKCGNPTPVNDSNSNIAKLPFVWPQVQSTGPETSEFNLDCIDINADVTVIRDPHKQRIAFWRSMLSKHKPGYL